MRVKPMFMILSIENEDTSGNFFHLAYNSTMNYELINVNLATKQYTTKLYTIQLSAVLI